ncbi:MAG TPA: hypothetical protein VN625_07120, partial [Desulfuromonadaceae bacterium]|nr:hypothetical protein [Desulfuromonadaceae bacterium]
MMSMIRGFLYCLFGICSWWALARTCSTQPDIRDPADRRALAMEIPADAVAWWQASGNADDSAGMNNGVLEGGLGFGAAEVGQGFLFTATNQAVRIPANSSLDVGAGNGFTIEGWINPTDVSGRHPIIEWNNGKW